MSKRIGSRVTNEERARRVARVRKIVQDKKAIGERVELAGIAEALNISTRTAGEYYKRAFGITYMQDEYNRCKQWGNNGNGRGNTTKGLRFEDEDGKGKM